MAFVLPRKPAAIAGVLLGMVAGSWAGAVGVKAAEALVDGGRVLVSAREVHALSSEQALQELPVQIRGVVTAAPAGWSAAFFFQDESAGGFVGGGTGPHVHPGDLVEVEGRSRPGSFAPYISGERWRILGRAPLPPPKSVSLEQLMTGAQDSLRVEFSGWCRSATWKDDERWELAVAADGCRLKVTLDTLGELEATNLVAARVRICGVAAASQSPSRQLVNVHVFCASPADLMIEQPETLDPWRHEPTPLEQIGGYAPENHPGRRVRVRAVVAQVEPGSVYLADASGGLEVLTDSTEGLVVGTQIEAVGFPGTKGFLPVLEDAVWKAAGQPARALAPKPVPIADLARGLHHADSVQVSGRLIDRSWEPGADAQAGARSRLTLVLQNEGRVFTAEVNCGQPPEQIPALALGGLLELRGVSCATPTAKGEPAGFRLLLPSLEAIRVLERPSWVTPQRLLAALCAALLLIVLCLVWSVRLARRNTRLNAENAEHQAVMAERARLADELHDTLQQGLVGVSLQLDVSGKALLEEPAKAQRHLDLARDHIQQTHAELRRSIWNLRPAALDRFNLAEALNRAAQMIAEGSELAIETQTVGHPVPLDPRVEENVLRIGQEALTNIVKHSHASRAEMRLSFAPELLSLVVHDDGLGFDREQVSSRAAGHFGLSGMSERAERIGGSLVIETAPGQGTTLRLTVPLSAAT